MRNEDGPLIAVSYWWRYLLSMLCILLVAAALARNLLPTPPSREIPNPQTVKDIG